MTYRVHKEVGFLPGTLLRVASFGLLAIASRVANSSIFFSSSPGYYCRESVCCSGAAKWNWTLAHILMTLVCQVVVTNHENVVYACKGVWCITV